ncbi:MAG: M67 family metallopeptidase [Anaerolineales bacterium]|nr:M67 family metallopeptidase [Anaerolineales bacterium]
MLSAELKAAPYVLERMRCHVDRIFPEEACGLLSGQHGMLVGVHPVTNVLHCGTRFRMDGPEQVRALQAIEKAGLGLAAIFHSHPEGPAELSAIDVREMHYPDIAHLIWSRAEGAWICRAYRMEDGQPREIRLVIAEE